MGFVLSQISILIFVFVHPINAIITLIVNIKAYAFPRTTDRIFFTSARDLDVYGNYAYRVTWNALFKKKNGHDFGKADETISKALGINQRDKKLTWAGWLMVYILWIIDPRYWFKGGHAINSIK